MRQRGQILLYLGLALAIVVTLGFIGKKIFDAGEASKQVEWDQANRDAEKKQRQDEMLRNKSSAKKDFEHAQTLNTLRGGYAAELKRLRSQSLGNGGTSSLSSAASSIACPDRQADVARRLENLEVGVLGLLERGDQAIIRANTCEGWLREQLTIKVE